MKKIRREFDVGLYITGMLEHFSWETTKSFVESFGLECHGKTREESGCFGLDFAFKDVEVDEPKEVKEMTVKEIEEALGYGVKITK